MESTSNSVDDLIISIMTGIDLLCNVSAEKNVAADTSDVTLQQRHHCLTSLARTAKDQKIDVMTSEKEAVEEICSVLEEDVKTLERLKLEKLLALQEDEETLKSLQEQLAQLREGKAELRKEGEMKVMEDVQLVLRKAKRLFRDAREDLDTVLELLLGSDRVMKSIILEITTVYFSGDDVYVTVEDKNWIPRLELLFKGGIVAYHPYNKKKIRLAAV